MSRFATSLSTGYMLYLIIYIMRQGPYIYRNPLLAILNFDPIRIIYIIINIAAAVRIIIYFINCITYTLAHCSTGARASVALGGWGRGSDETG